jgi:hypothetical protein
MAQRLKCGRERESDPVPGLAVHALQRTDIGFGKSGGAKVAIDEWECAKHGRIGLVEVVRELGQALPG